MVVALISAAGNAGADGTQLMDVACQAILERVSQVGTESESSSRRAEKKRIGRIQKSCRAKYKTSCPCGRVPIASG